MHFYQKIVSCLAKLLLTQTHSSCFSKVWNLISFILTLMCLNALLGEMLPCEIQIRARELNEKGWRTTTIHSYAVILAIFFPFRVVPQTVEVTLTRLCLRKNGQKNENFLLFSCECTLFRTASGLHREVFLFRQRKIRLAYFSVYFLIFKNCFGLFVCSLQSEFFHKLFGLLKLLCQ